MYTSKKILIGDIIASILLLLCTKLPYLCDDYSKYTDVNISNFYLIQYVLTCIFWFVFIAFIASRILKFFNHEPKNES